MKRLAILVSACCLAVAWAPLSQAQNVGDASETRQAEIDQLLDQAVVAHRSGDLETTIAKLRLAIPLVEAQVGRSSYDYAVLVYDLGQILIETERHEEALPVLDLAVEATREWFGPNNQRTLSALNNQASNLSSLGRHDEAERIFVDVIARRRGDPTLGGIALANVLGNYASLLDLKGSYPEAEPLHREALQIKERELGAEHEETLVRVGNLAANLKLQGRIEEAEAMMLAVLEKSDQNELVDPSAQITRLTNYANTLDSQRRFEEAEDTHVEAVELARSSGSPLDLAHALKSYGNNQSNLGRFDVAYESGTEAFRIYEAQLGGDHINTLGVGNNLAILDVARGNYRQAALGFSYIIERLGEAGLKRTELGRSALGNLSATLLLDPEQSHNAHRPLGELVVDTIARRRLAKGRSGRFPEMEHWAIFALFAEAQWAVRQHRLRTGLPEDPRVQDMAFRSIQEAMIGPATSAIADRAAERFASTNPVAAELARSRELLLTQMSELEAQLSDELARIDKADLALRENLREEISTVRSRLDQTNSGLQAAAPEYFHLLQPEPLGFVAVQQLLAPDEAILAILPGPYATHAIAVSRERIEWFRPDWRKPEIDGAVRRLLWDASSDFVPTPEEREQWQNPPKGAFDRATAFAMYRQLIEPARPVIDGKAQLFIAGGSSLASLPFSMLVSEKPVGDDADPGALRQTRWLGDEFALVQLPSVQSLGFLRSRKSEPQAVLEKRFLGFGDPALDGLPGLRGRGRGGVPSTSTLRGLATRTADLNVLKAMPRLPGTARELTAIWRALGSPDETLYLAEDATEGNVKTHTLSAETLVFATHGLLANSMSELGEPGLVLTPPDTASAIDDGFLSASEIASLRINADWVILSACNTAASDGRQFSNGLSGMARAFFYAGAHDLLVSHWPVRDDVAAELTVRSIRLLESDPSLSRAEAFQRAMRDIRNDKVADGTEMGWAHPSAWAPFTLVGSGR